MDNIDEKMNKSIIDLNKRISSLSTGRANADMIKDIQVDYYGSTTPIQQLAAISIPEANQFLLDVYDINSVKNIERALMQSNLSLNPQIDGKVVRINLPDLTEDRRKELVKLVKQMSEDAKISIRNIRRDILDQFKKQEKNNEITQDELKTFQENVQKSTDHHISAVEDIVKQKESEILTI